MFLPFSPKTSQRPLEADGQQSAQPKDHVDCNLVPYSDILSAKWGYFWYKDPSLLQRKDCQRETFSVNPCREN